jgi:hypothetical protein
VLEQRIAKPPQRMRLDPQRTPHALRPARSSMVVRSGMLCYCLTQRRKGAKKKGEVEPRNTRKPLKRRLALR